MSDDPLNRARRKLLASTSAMLDTLTAEDVGGTFRSIAPGLEAARATGRTSAVTAILGRVGDQVATEIGVDLGWDFLDATPWTGQQVRAAYAGRLNRVADWLTEQQAAGRDAYELLIWTRSWQQAIAGSDVHQVAREATIVVAGNSPVIGRVQRIAEPGACAWCRMMSSRGAVYVTEATALSSGHAHCRCEIATVTNPKAIEQSRQAGQEAWRASELSSSKSPFRNRRGGGPRPDPALFKPGAKTSERETAIRAQIASYEQTLPGLRKAVADGDEAQRKALDWQEAKAAELRRELGSATGLTRLGKQVRSPVVNDVAGAYPRTQTGVQPPFGPASRPSISAGSRRHILARHGINGPAQTTFAWPEQEVWNAIDLAMADPDSVEHFGDSFVFTRQVKDEIVRVTVRTDTPRPFVWTAYPKPRG
jgi:hypothetical protein